MKGRRLLTVFLLGVSLCFVPVMGYGEVKHGLYKQKASLMDFHLLEAKVEYIMRNPANFLDIVFSYDPYGVMGWTWDLPENVDTERKICVEIWDNRGIFSYESGMGLLEQFKEELEVVYSYIEDMATYMDTDIVAIFYSEEDILLGYFYQGEYYFLQEE